MSETKGMDVNMSKLRTAVVGLNMGMGHAYAYHKSEQSELRWVVDLDEEKASCVAQELNCKYSTDLKSVLGDIDAISICTPHHLHAPMALQAIDAGIHVLLEKPLANTEEDCLKVIKAAEGKGVTLMLAYVLRYLPAFVRLKEAIETEEFGKPFNIDCSVMGYMKPNPGSWFSKKDAVGGGVLFSQGCHYIDIIQWLMGDPIKVSSFSTRNGTDWMEGEGTSQSIMQFENGAIGRLEASWGMKYKEAPPRFQVHTPEAALILVKSSQLDVITEEGRRTLFEDKQQSKEKGSNVIHEVEHFLHCIRTGEKPSVDGNEALRSHRTIWAMYGHEGTPVKAVE